MPSSRDLIFACKTERRDDSLDLSSVEEMKVSSPEHSGTVRYVRLPPASPRSAHPSLKTRMTLPCFVHRSMRKWAIEAALWIRISAGRARRQPERHSAARQASVASVLKRDSMPKRSKRAAVAPTRTVRVQQKACDLLRRECQYSMTLRSVFKMLR